MHILGGETFSAGYANGGGDHKRQFELLGPQQLPNASDGFVAKINTPATDGSLAYFTYLGGSDTDTVAGITLDAGAPDVIATGSTMSTDFPVTAAHSRRNAGQMATPPNPALPTRASR